MSAAVAALLLLLAAPQVLATGPYRVADLLRLGDGHTTRSSAPEFLAVANGVAFFVARDGSSPFQYALWRTDGTPAGTFALIDAVYTNRRSVFVEGDALYLLSAHGTTWRSDGTVAGTTMLSLDDGDQVVGKAGDALYFLRAAGRDLWVRDSNGERVLANIRNGQPAWTEVGAWGDRVFIATERGLWTTDGTEAETRKLTSISAWNAVAAGDRLFFVTDRDPLGMALWTSDGSAGGTMVVASVAQPGTQRKDAIVVALDARRVLFLGGGSLIVSDGTALATSTLRTGVATLPQTMAVAGGIAYFAFDDGTYGRELWRSDGTDAGTWLVRDAIPGPRGGSIRAIGAGATQVYYYDWIDAESRLSGLHVTDGTANGTRVLQAAIPYCCTGDTTEPVLTRGDQAYFTAWTKSHGYEPWTSDGTPAGTRIIANLVDDPNGDSYPRDFVAGESRLYFTADSDEDSAIWSTDGTPEGTIPMVRSEKDDLRPLGILGDALYFAKAREIRKTSAGDDVLVHPFGSYALSSAGRFNNSNGRLLFFGNGEIWSTDGTTAGTNPLLHAYHPIRPPLLFAGRTWLLGDALAETDGTPRGTREVSRTTGVWRRRTDLIPFRGALYVLADESLSNDTIAVTRFSGGHNDTSIVARFQPRFSFGWVTQFGAAPITSAIVVNTGRELWRTDGTQSGTERILEMMNTYDTGLTPAIVSLGDRAVFTANTEIGRELWVTDGTAAGTRLLQDIRPGWESSDAGGFFVADGVAYFAATDRDHGRELWQTDGTSSGTRMVADLAPGQTSSSPASILRVGDLLYFSASTPDAGRELWAWLLPDAHALTIEDVGAAESDGQIVIPVRLTRASRERVTVDYATADSTAFATRDYIPASGRLTFEPGETVKSIVVSIVDDKASGTTRAFLVHLSNETVPIERRTGSVLIEDDDRRADVAISVTGSFAQPIVRNTGPDAASNVNVCHASEREAPRCEQHFSIPAGATVGLYIPRYKGIYEASAMPWEPDPNPANNAMTVSVTDHAFAVPAVLRPGESGTITVSRWLLQHSNDVLVPSDPTVIRVGAPVSVDDSKAVATWTAVRPGTATIGSGTTEPLIVGVSDAEGPLRMPVKVTAGFSYQRRFASNTAVYARVEGTRVDGAKPSGALQLFIDGEGHRFQPVRGTDSAFPAILLPGRHQISVRYNGDDRFLAAAHSTSVDIAKGLASVHPVLRDGTLTIDVRGVPGYAPTGVIVLEGRTVPLTPHTSDTARATFGPYPLNTRTIAFSYSGDALYESATVTLPVEQIPPRKRIGVD